MGYKMCFGIGFYCDNVRWVGGEKLGELNVGKFFV